MKEKINGYYLDTDQQQIVLDNSNYLLVVAGAGSGKTLTILGKINYLINYKNINPEEIICISFTKKASTDLQNKIYQEFHKNINVYTFHKLAIEILKSNNTNFEIADPSLLQDIINNFFLELENNNEYMYLVLNYFNKYPLFHIKENYKRLDKDKIIILKKELETFIRLFKCNNHTLKDFTKFLNQIKTINYYKYQKNKIFLILVLNIYLEYFNYLKESKELDFDDLIIEATNIIMDNYNKKVKYIITDEYQDTSFIRFNLVKELINKTSSQLMVVGDDYQSIYKFTGCDIALFTNFKTYFPNANILRINNTYRNSKELIQIAGNFIMKNKDQIPKILKSNKSLENPIQIIYYNNIKESFKKLINSINTKEILILGRNNNDIYSLLDNDYKLEGESLIYKNNENLKLKYLTIHKSKGLESENVIIINLENKTLGFPSKIKNKDIFDLVTINKEKYKYAEERRLFYVALTRTKNHTYLLVPKSKPSIFIKELIQCKEVTKVKK